MQPYKIEFYIYGESEAEAAELAKALYDFVESKRQSGIAVTAKRLTEALVKFKDNYFVNNYLK